MRFYFFFVLLVLNVEISFSQNSWHSIGTGFGNTQYTYVNTMKEFNGTIYVGGHLHVIPGVGNDDFHFLKTNGLDWTYFPCLMNGSEINAIEEYKGKLVIGGSLIIEDTLTSATFTTGLAVWDGTRWSILGDTIYGTVIGLAIVGNDLYVGGSISRVGNKTYMGDFIMWDGAKWQEAPPNYTKPGVLSPVTAMTKSGTDIYIAYKDELYHYDIAKPEWKSLIPNACSWTVSNWEITSLLYRNNRLYIGSKGSRLCNLANISHDICYVNALGLLVNLGNNVDGAVYDIKEVDGDLYICGNFQDAGNDPNADYIAKWNGTDWENIGVTPNNIVYSMLTAKTNISSNDQFYIGGKFSNLGGDPYIDGFARYGENTVPYPTICNEQAIRTVDSLLYFDKSNYNRLDYHKYALDTIVCHVTKYSIDTVWEKMKSDYRFQVPQSEDFSIFSLMGIYCESDKPDNIVPVSQCLKAEITSKFRYAASIFYWRKNNILPLPVLTDSVIVVVDEKNKCITNYTLPQHMLYPGRVKRCLVIEECDRVKLNFTGEGYNTLGNTNAGMYLAELNKYIGRKAFDNMNKRFIKEATP